MKNLIFPLIFLVACNSPKPEQLQQSSDIETNESVRKETNRELKAAITNHILYFVKSNFTDELDFNYNILLQTGDLSNESEILNLNLSDYENIRTICKSCITKLIFTNNYSSYIFLNKDYNVPIKQDKDTERIRITIQYLKFNSTENTCDIALAVYIADDWGSIELLKLKYDEELHLEIISRYLIAIS